MVTHHRQSLQNHLNEGMNLLSKREIPYTVERFAEEQYAGIIRLPKEMSQRLRECGFRVGSEIFEGENVVYYKGRFFGVTAG